MKKVIIFLSVITVALIFTIWVLRVNGGQKLYMGGRAAKGIMKPKIIGSDLYFFNGRSFIKSSLSGGGSSLLTKPYNFPDILSADYSARGALFEATSYRPSDSFSPLLDALNLPANTSYWWLADFKSGAITLVKNPVSPSARMSAVWRNDGEGYLTAVRTPEQNTQDDIYYYPADGSTIRVAQTHRVVSAMVWASNQEAVYEAAGQSSGYDLVRINFGSGQETVLATGIVPGSAVSRDGQLTAYNKPAGKSNNEVGYSNSDLYLVKTGSRPVLVVKRFNGIITWSQRLGRFLISGSQGSSPILGAFTAGDSLIKFSIEGQKTIPEMAFASIASARPLGIWFTDLNGDLFFLSQAKNQAGVTIVTPRYDGLESLIEVGATQAQLLSLRGALDGFSQSRGRWDSLSLDKGSIKLLPRDPGSYDDQISFRLSGGGQSYDAKLKYQGLTGISLFLYKPGSEELVYQIIDYDITKQIVR